MARHSNLASKAALENDCDEEEEEEEEEDLADKKSLPPLLVAVYFFQADILFSIMNAKFWPILSRIYALLGVLLQVVYQNWQISGMKKEEEVDDVDEDEEEAADDDSLVL